MSHDQRGNGKVLFIQNAGYTDLKAKNCREVISGANDGFSITRISAQ